MRFSIRAYTVRVFMLTACFVQQPYISFFILKQNRSKKKKKKVKAKLGKNIARMFAVLVDKIKIMDLVLKS